MNTVRFSPSFALMVRQSTGVWLLLIVTAGIAWAQVLLPNTFGRLIDAAVAQQATAVDIAWYAGSVIAVQLVLWLCTLLATHVSWSGTNAVRTALVTHIVHQPREFFRRHGIGELTERLDADVDEVADVLARNVPQVLRAAVVLGSVLWTTTQTDGRIMLLLCAYVVIGAVVVAQTQQHTAAAWEQERAADAALFDTIHETLSSTVDLQSVHAQPFAQQLLAPRIADRMRTHRRAAMQNERSTVVAGAITALGWLFAALIGLWRDRSGSGSVGDVIALIGMVRLLALPIEAGSTQYTLFLRAVGAFRRCDALLATPTWQPNGTRDLPEGPLAVKITNLSFRYPDAERDAVHDVSLTITDGQHVALMGRTGSGKTTLGRLVAQFEQPTAGDIVIAGIPLAEVHGVSVRQRIGVIPQEIDILPTTLRNNLSGGLPTCSDSDIITCIQDLGLHTWYASFAEGLDTLLQDDGRIISPGEAQLLAFVRVSLRNPGLVILDEATAQMDPQTERLLRTAIEHIAAHRTTITIAHRLSTADAADVVVVLADGHIIEQGAPAFLSANSDSHYARLRATQAQAAT